MWEIKGKDNQTKATVYALEYNGEWMGESYVTVTIESPTPIAFAIGDYLMYRGERFEINYDPGKIKSAPQFATGDAFKYENIKFNSLADELTRCDFLDVVLGDNQLHFTGLPKFSFYGGVQDLANRIQANLNRAYPNQWMVVVSSEYTGTTELNVQVGTLKVWGALDILVNQFKTYFTIKGRTITIGAAGIPAGHLFKYGKDNGLYEIEQNAEADQAIVTRLRAYGSTRNLPHRYYNSLTGADGQKLIPDNMAVQYLMLPDFPYNTQDPYIDSANKGVLGIREGSIFFDGSQEGLDEIYPSIEGMTAEDLHKAGVPCNSTGALDEIVSAEQMTDDGVGEINEGETEATAKPPTFKVTLKDLGFDINDHLTTETATLSFKTGMLGGRDFEIVGCKKVESNGKVTGYELELNRVYDDGIKLWFPYSAYNAKTGDKFVLLHIEMPEVYIKAAAQRLLEAATAWLAKNDYSRSVYAPKVDEIFMARQHDVAMASGGTIASLHDTLKEGMLLLFEDDDLNIDASIFIDRLTIKEGDGPVPTYEVTLKEEKTVGRLDKMQNQIDSLSAGMGQGGAGYNAAQIRSMIDAYGGTRFLSKLKDDRAIGKIASDIGIEIGNYLAGASGGIFAIDKTTNDSFAEVARLFVRGKAYFETLTIIEAATLAGKQYISPGGSIKCTSVEKIKNDAGSVVAYRCYFLSEQDGEKIETKMVAGDQAISEMFNAAPGTSNKVSNHRYWRLVTAANNDAYTDASGNHYGYVELSATDCETNSDIPKAGDTIDQLGNRDDATRRAAMVFDTVGADAPSIKLFTGIGSGETNAEHYSLDGRDIISQGYDHVKGHAYFKCYGDTYVGSPDGSTYVKYDQDTKKTSIKADLEIGSTIGDKPIGDYVSEAVQDAQEPRIALSAEVIGLECEADGSIIGTVPNVKVSVFKGATELRDWNISGTPSGCAIMRLDLITAPPSPATFRVYNIVDDLATIDFTATKGDKTLTARCQLYKVRPGANGEDAVLYTLETNTQIVKRDFAGTATPNVISCTKHKTAGNSGRVSTGDNILKAKVYHNGVAGSEQTIAAAGTHSGTVSVTADVTEVELSLYASAGNALLARVRVPVVSDMDEYYPASDNLIVNSALNNGTRDWYMDAGVTKTEELTFEGDSVFKISANGLTTDYWKGFQQGYKLFPECTQLIVPKGVKYLCAAVWVYKKANIAYDRGASMSVTVYDADGNELAQQYSNIVPNAYNTWERKTLLMQLPEGSYSVRLYCMVVRNGELYGAHPQLHWGNALPEWSASKYDFNYVAQALKGTTTLSGGLALMSMIQLGEGSGDDFTARAGINGVVQGTDNKDVAMWAGGTFDDALNKSATYTVYMDGTIRAADGTVEINASQMKILGKGGSYVTLDNNGLSLFDKDGVARLRVTNENLPLDASVGVDNSDELEWPKLENSLTTRFKYTMGMVTPSISRMESVTLVSSNKSTYQLPQAVTAKSVLQMDITVPFNYNFTDSNAYVSGMVALKLFKNNTEVKAWKASFNKISKTSFEARFSINEILENGSYRLEVSVVPNTSVTYDASRTSQPTGTGKITYGLDNQNFLGNNGMLSTWGKSILCVREGDVYMRHGAYGIKVSDSGLQQWDNANSRWVSLLS